MGSYDNGPSDGYIDSGDPDARSIKQMMDHYYQSSYPANAAYWQQGAIDKRFKVGDQTLWSLIYGDNQYYQSRRFFFNLIRRHINMIVGHQRKNRKSGMAIPLHDEDQLADDYNMVIRWCDDRDGFQEYLSQAFEGACDVGGSLLHMYPDYTLDPISGDLFTDNVSYNNYLIDPYYRKQDLTDCNFIWRRRWVSKNAAKALLPGREKEIDKMQPCGIKDGRFPLQAELLNLDTNRLFPYDEFHYRCSREALMVIDPKTGEAVEWEPDPEDPDNMLDEMLYHQPWLITKKVQVPTVKLGISLGGRVLYKGQNLLKIDPYPFVPVLCYHEPDIQSYAWRQQGIVRNLRDAQFLYNRRKVIELAILESQITSGWIYPVDALTDPKSLRQTGEGYLVPLKSGHLPQEIERIQPPSIPESLMALSQGLAEDITKISGVSEELLGSADDDKAGILAMLRQGASLTTLQTIFDKLDYSQRLYTKIRMDAIRKNFSKGKVSSILRREVHPDFYSSVAKKYSLTTEEGAYSTTQRQTELRQLLHFQEMGLPIPMKSIINKAFISDKKQLLQDMEEEQQQQAESQQAEAAQQEKKDNAELMLKYAKAQESQAKVGELEASANEKVARISDILSNAEYKQTEADLNLVEQMIKLEDMDLANFRSALEMAELIKLKNDQTLQQQIPQEGYYG